MRKWPHLCMSTLRNARKRGVNTIMQVAVAASLLIAILPGLADSGRTDFADANMLKELRQRYDVYAERRGETLNRLLQRLRTADTRTQLTEINDFFNQFRYRTDQDMWGAEDYWQTPVEFIGNFAGDCEDYVISKYFALLHLGIDESKLYITYAKATEQRIAHMVLIYIDPPGAVPLVLDNYNKTILPATERKDLIPVYSFNGSSLFLSHSAGLGRALPSDKVRNSRWDNLLKRVQEQKP